MTGHGTEARMAEIFSRRSELARFARLDVAVCRARAARGDMPREAFERIASHAMHAVERAACAMPLGEPLTYEVYRAALDEAIGSAARYVGIGVSEAALRAVCLASQLCDAAAWIDEACQVASSRLRDHAVAHRHTLCLDPTTAPAVTTAGALLLGAAAELRRGQARLARARRDVACVSVVSSGAASGSLRDLADALRELRLREAPTAGPLAGDDRWVAYGGALVALADSVARATTLIARLEAGGDPAQDGGAERVLHGDTSGAQAGHALGGLGSHVAAALAELVDTDASAARDASPRGATRAAAPLRRATMAVHGGLARLAASLERLALSPVGLRDAFDGAGGAPFRGAVEEALRRRGVPRHEAAARVALAMERATSEALHLLDALRASADVTAALRDDALDACFDLEPRLAEVDARFALALEAVGRPCTSP
jgi:adenylosuccinate lyase